MTDLRDTGTVAAARFDDDQIQLREFLRVDFTGGPGTLRYTNLIGGFVGNIDGTSQTWTEFPLTVGPLQQGRDTAQEVSWIELGDADGTNLWVGYLKTPGVREVPCTVYRAHFNVTTGAIYGAYKLYPGDMDEGRDTGSRVRIVLVPSADRTMIPGRAFLPHMPEFQLLPRAGDVITFGSKTVELAPAPTFQGWPGWPIFPS